MNPFTPSIDPNLVAGQLLRPVRVQSRKQTTTISTSCSVGGSICFMRAGASGQGSRFVEMFRLVPPEKFGNGAVVFGISGSILDRLRRDDGFVAAVSALLAKGFRLTLQKNKLVFTVGNTNARHSKDALSSHLVSVAMRIEALVGTSVNESAGAGQLLLPYTVLSFASGIGLGLCLGFTKASLAPLRIAGYSLALGFVIACVMTLFVIPAHLRKQPLGGAVVLNALLAAVLSSALLSPALVVMANTYLGEKLLLAQQIRTSGTIVVTHAKHTYCSLFLDEPSSTILDGTLIRQLPITCNDVQFHADPMSHPYDVSINPGLLGVPFVQAIHATEEN